MGIWVFRFLKGSGFWENYGDYRVHGRGSGPGPSGVGVRGGGLFQPRRKHHRNKHPSVRANWFTIVHYVAQSNMRQSGWLVSRRGFAVESVVAQICWECGARVSTNVMVRELDNVQGNTDSRTMQTERC